MVDKQRLGDIAAKVVRIVPGIGTYQDKEKLRDVDKRLREYLASTLDRERGRINEVKTLLAKKLALNPLDDLDRLSRKLYQVSDTIKFASYGWSAIFDQAAVDKQRLERLYEFDQSLESVIAEVQGDVDRLVAAPEKDLETTISDVERSLGVLENTLKKREQLLKEV